MKVCELCGVEIYTKDGENRCLECENAHLRKAIKLAERRANRAARDEAMRSLGLTKVKGQLGGTYWE